MNLNVGREVEGDEFSAFALVGILAKGESVLGLGKDFNIVFLVLLNYFLFEVGDQTHELCDFLEFVFAF